MLTPPLAPQLSEQPQLDFHLPKGPAPAPPGSTLSASTRPVPHQIQGFARIKGLRMFGIFGQSPTGDLKKKKKKVFILL